MRQRKKINIARVPTALTRPGIAPYTATKGAGANLISGMATEWGRYGLQCNAMRLRAVTSILRSTKHWWKGLEFSVWLANRTPAGRLGEIEVLHGAVIFLASSASSFVNGHTVFADGGITASLELSPVLEFWSTVRSDERVTAAVIRHTS